MPRWQPEKERLVIYDGVIWKKTVLPKKNLTTIDGVNRIPTIPPPRHRTIGIIDRSLNDESLGIQKNKTAEQRNVLQVITAGPLTSKWHKMRKLAQLKASHKTQHLAIHISLRFRLGTKKKKIKKSKKKCIQWVYEKVNFFNSSCTKVHEA